MLKGRDGRLCNMMITGEDAAKVPKFWISLFIRSNFRQQYLQEITNGA